MKRKTIPWTVLFVIAIALVSCGTEFDANQEKKNNSSINGAWNSIGHGWVLEIVDSLKYSFYDITPISCVPRRSAHIEELKNAIRVQNDTLVLVSGEIRYWCTRTNELPRLCSLMLDEKKTKDPLYNFDVFSETIKEHYAFFELNEIDWDQLYKSQRAKLSSKSSLAELYLVLEETYEIINDNHSFLNATDDVYDEIDLLLAKEVNDMADDTPKLGDFPTAQKVAEHHLIEEMTEDCWLMQWGMLTDDLGYIQLKSMWLYADLNISNELKDSLGFVDAFGSIREEMFVGEYMEKEVEGVRKVMDQVMSDLSETNAIVIDVRFNGGGQDAVSFEILRHFNSETLQVATHKFRYGNKYTIPMPIYVDGSTDAYTKPVYILTSPQSGSAAESFSLASLSMPHVKRIGSATEGALSNTLDKKLPIGWDFYLSSEVYMDNDGKFYENEGVPPDYELNYPKERQAFFGSVLGDLEKDKRDILLAIENIGKK